MDASSFVHSYRWGVAEGAAQIWHLEYEREAILLVWKTSCEQNIICWNSAFSCKQLGSSSYQKSKT